MKMKITFLGTGTSTGVPMIGCQCSVCKSVDFRDKRLRSSVHIAVNGQSFVIDTTPDFRQQMLRAHITRLDAILFTHQHKDHTAGLDDVRAFNFHQQKDMPIYGTQPVLQQIQTEFAYVFAAHKYPGIPEIALQYINNAPFCINGIEILPIEVMHHQLPVLGFRIGDFTYITDANYISDTALKKVIGTKYLVINALQKTPHISHFTLQQALEVIEKICPEKAFLTHLSHKMGRHAEVSAELPPHVQIAYDGLEIIC